MPSAAALEQAAQRAWLRDTIAAIDDIGIVHDRPRYGDAHQHWVTTINGKDQIRAWELGLESPGVSVSRLSANHRHRYRTWLIRGYVYIGDDDATYNTIIDLAGDIADAIDADPTMGGAALHTTTPVQVAEPVVLTIGGGTLCWGITLTVVPYTVVMP